MKRGFRLGQLRAQLGVVNLDEHLVPGDPFTLLKLHRAHLAGDFRAQLGGFVGGQGADEGERFNQIAAGDVDHLYRLPEPAGRGCRAGRFFPATGRQAESEQADENQCRAAEERHPGSRVRVC